MTATDAQRADEHATGLLARHLENRLAAHVDPGIVAGRLVELLREAGWRPIPRPQLPGQQGGPQGDYKAGASAVREALAEARKPKEDR